jgi:hypothetical protein
MKSKKYKVGVSRTAYAFNYIEVEATSEEEAEMKALECAGDYNYSEHDADYAVEGVTLIKKDKKKA